MESFGKQDEGSQDIPKQKTPEKNPFEDIETMTNSTAQVLMQDAFVKSANESQKKINEFMNKINHLEVITGENIDSPEYETNLDRRQHQLDMAKISLESMERRIDMAKEASPGIKKFVEALEELIRSADKYREFEERISIGRKRIQDRK